MNKVVDSYCVLYNCMNYMTNDKVHFTLALFIVHNTCLPLRTKNFQCFFRYISIAIAQDVI